MNVKSIKILIITLFFFLAMSSSELQSQNYPIVDTGQELCYNTVDVIACPEPGESFYGQDAQFNGNQPGYQDNGNGTITDLVTGLMWQQNLLDTKFTYEEALTAADTFSLAGYEDWRLPTIKELYSLILFNGKTGMSAEESIPYIDTNYFEFRYGDEYDPTSRFIDAQYATKTEYVSTTMNNEPTMFGVNFADGRIKGYPQSKEFEVKFVRGNTNYGINDFVDNEDGTITDESTGLTWDKTGSSTGMNWGDALAWVQQKNDEDYLGYDDWRLPNAKELQSLIDYTRSPATTNSAAISELFEVPQIIDEGGETDYPFYWSNTTHDDGPVPEKAVYLAFGNALGFMEIPPNSGNYILMDVHGAGAQRSDPKVGDPSNFPHGFGPQGDVIRIYNYVRLVRGGLITDVKELKSELPNEFDLEQNFPNPFNPTTTIKYSISKTGNVKLKVYDVLGNEIVTLVDEVHSPGNYEVEFNASKLTSGVYIYQLESGNFIQSKKLILLK